MLQDLNEETIGYINEIPNQIYYDGQLIQFIQKIMNEYVFNDIYGNESARNKYQENPEYTYFNNVLKLHNKYYEDGEMHSYIFSPRIKIPKLHTPEKSLKVPNGNANETIYTYYNVQKLNSRTFRVSKKNRNIGVRHIQKQAERQYQTIESRKSNVANRDIKADVKILQNTLNPKLNISAGIRNGKWRAHIFHKNQPQRYEQASRKQDMLTLASAHKNLRCFSHQYT